LNLLDTAGQERFRTLSNSYYRGAHGVILVYDISNRESFLAMEKWYDEAESNAMPGAIMYLVCATMLTDILRPFRDRIFSAEAEYSTHRAGLSFINTKLTCPKGWQ
jgi:GTPase SAR1 family protein